MSRVHSFRTNLTLSLQTCHMISHSFACIYPLITQRVHFSPQFTILGEDTYKRECKKKPEVKANNRHCMFNSFFLTSEKPLTTTSLVFGTTSGCPLHEIVQSQSVEVCLNSHLESCLAPAEVAKLHADDLRLSRTSV